MKKISKDNQSFMDMLKKKPWVAVIIAVVVVLIIVMAVFLTLKMKDTGAEASSGTATPTDKNIVLSYQPFPSAENETLTYTPLNIDVLNGKKVKIECFVPEVVDPGENQPYFAAESEALGLSLYVGESTDALKNFSDNWLKNFCKEKGFVPEECFLSDNGDEKIYLLLGNEEDGSYSGRGFIISDKASFVVALGTVRRERPKDEAHIARVREASLHVLQSFTLEEAEKTES